MCHVCKLDMRIEAVMEMPEKYMSAYNYYKKNLEQDESMTKPALLAKVARMFAIPNFKHFQRFVQDLESRPDHYYG